MLLVAVNALVGATLGQERTVVPLLAEQVFGLSGFTAGLLFIVAFGLVKAATNFFAGIWSDRFGRKPVLVAGWLIALPVPAMLIWGPNWWWVVAANVLLGVNQGLTWSTTVIMKIDLVGSRAARPGDGPERGRRLRRRRRRRPDHGLAGCRSRAAAGAVPVRCGGHRARPGPVGAGRAGDPRPRQARGRDPRHGQRQTCTRS